MKTVIIGIAGGTGGGGPDPYFFGHPSVCPVIVFVVSDFDPSVRDHFSVGAHIIHAKLCATGHIAAGIEIIPGTLDALPGLPGIGAVQIPVTETYRIFNESGWP